MISVKAYASSKGASLLRSDNLALLRRRRTEASRIDRDVLNFCAKGSSDRPNRIGETRLNVFVQTIKSMGLWSDMVCWPCRRFFRSRNSLVLASLGGWQEANATASATHVVALNTENVVQFSNQATVRNLSITMTEKNGLSDFHFVCVFRNLLNNVDANGHLVILEPWSLYQSTSAGNMPMTDGPNTIMGYVDTTKFQVMQFGQNGSTRYLQTGNARNESTPGAPVALSGEDLIIGGSTSSPYGQFQGFGAFFAMFKKSLSVSQASQINLLLQQTLLRGLRV